MKSIVVFDSLTGNTEKIAKQIAKGLKCPVKHIDKIKDIKKYNFIVIGTPVHGAKPSKKISEFLSLLKIKKYAFFCTYGLPLFGQFTARKCLEKMQNKLQGLCHGKFICKGRHEYLFAYKNHPNQEDLLRALNFGKNLQK